MKPYICTNVSEAGVLIAASFAYVTISEEPLELHFAPEARAHANRRRLSRAGRQAVGLDGSRDKSFLPARVADRM
jgi:hypothetical protein